MVVVAGDRLWPLLQHAGHVEAAVLVGVRHLAPDEEAHLVAPIQPARVLDLLVLAGAVEAERLGELDVALDRLVGRRGQDTLRPVALVEDEPQVVGRIVEVDLARVGRDLPLAEIALQRVEHLAAGDRFQRQVVQGRVLGAPEPLAGQAQCDVRVAVGDPRLRLRHRGLVERHRGPQPQVGRGAAQAGNR